MSTTFSRWKNRVVRDGKKSIQPVTYVCGSEQVLIEDVVRTMWEVISPPPFDSVRISVDSATLETDVWAAINQFSLDGEGLRLVQIREAQRLVNWSFLDRWIEYRSLYKNSYILFVGCEEAPDKSYNRGQVVVCNTPNDEDLVSWVKSNAVHLDNETAQHLISRTGCDLQKIANACDKIALFSGKPSPAVIDALVDVAPLDTFAEALLTLDRRSAALAVPSVPAQDLRGVVGLLDSRLDLLTRLRASRWTQRELASIPGVPVWLAKRYASVSRDYDPSRVLRRRRVLAVVDDALSRGETSGVLEALVALW